MSSRPVFSRAISYHKVKLCAKRGSETRMGAAAKAKPPRSQGGYGLLCHSDGAFQLTLPGPPPSSQSATLWSAGPISTSHDRRISFNSLSVMPHNSAAASSTWASMAARVWAQLNCAPAPWPVFSPPLAPPVQRGRINTLPRRAGEGRGGGRSPLYPPSALLPSMHLGYRSALSQQPQKSCPEATLFYVRFSS